MKLGAALFLMGLPGVVLVGLFIIPAMLQFAPDKPTTSTQVIIAVTIAQSSVFLLLALWAGGTLASKVGLEAPIVSGLIRGNRPSSGFQTPLLYGLVGGVVGAIILFLATRYAPAGLTGIQAKLSPPLPVRVFYGGVTEELLTRWGLMSLILWSLWRFVQDGSGLPQPRLVWVAITLSAMLFGVLHLPVIAALVGKLTGVVVSYVVAANALFGLVAGFLFWRHGLEAAIVAHGSAHVISWAAESIWTR